MAEEFLRLRLKAIEAELTNSQPTAVLGGGAPEIAMALLTRQAELLAEKARIQVNLGEDTAAVQTADEAERLAGNLRFHASRRSHFDGAPAAVDVDLERRISMAAATAKTSRALAYVALGSLAEARALLGQLRKNSDVNIEEIEKALRREEDGRVDLVTHETDKHLADNQLALQQHWGDAEQQLTEIADVIAKKIVEAGNLVQRTAHADRFMNWLSTRIDWSVRKLRAAEASTADATTEPFLLSAAARGEDFRRQVFESGELLPAAALRPSTDDLLKPHRDGGWLMALQHPDDPSRFGYPWWQFNQSHHGLVMAIWKKLDAVDPWGRWMFFHTPSPRLHNLTPLQALGIEKDRASAEPYLGARRMTGDMLEVGLHSAAEGYLNGDE